MAKKSKDNTGLMLLGLVAVAVLLVPSGARANALPQPDPSPNNIGPARRFDPYVEKLQRFLNLNAVQPQLNPDGVYGSKTDRNVRVFLGRTGLTAAELRARVEAWRG